MGAGGRCGGGWNKQQALWPYDTLAHLMIKLNMSIGVALIGCDIDELPEEVGTLKLLQTLHVRGSLVMGNTITFSMGLLAQLLCLRYRSLVRQCQLGLGGADVPAGAGDILFC